MFANLRSVLAAAALAVGLVACSSTGYSTKSSLVVPRTIRTPANIPSELAPYVPRFIAALEAKGFTVGKTEDPQALDLVFEFNGNPFNLRVAAGLWLQGIPVLTASATNPGWGTVLARGGAVNSLANKAAKQFVTELDTFANKGQIVPDASH